MHNPIEEAQLQMQQKLGRCMLRLQQYERLLKAMISSMAVEGPLGDLNSKRARQVAKASGKSLGTLVQMFTGSHLISTPVVGEKVKGDVNSGDLRPDVAWLSTRFNISMPPELYAQTTEGLSELVAMRNDMVHHLIERFDISNEDGCRAAATHLDSCYDKINGHLERLNAWANGLANTQAAVLSFLESKAFEDAFGHGINPDGTVCWRSSAVVECLRSAETACQVDGWTSLAAALVFISKDNRDQIPSRYGCKTWRQVLRESGFFDLRRVAVSSAAKGQTWYRSASDPV